ncbi:MAG: hypothetical protein R3B55_03565 [Candidatus Paceibacterota bacterium]
MNKVLKISSSGRDGGLGCSYVEEALPVVAKSLRNVHGETDINMQVTLGRQYEWNVWKHFPEDGLTRTLRMIRISSSKCTLPLNPMRIGKRRCG